MVQRMNTRLLSETMQVRVLSGVRVTNYTLEDYLIVEAECCRVWPVAFMVPMGRCGYCGRRPVIRYPLVIVRRGANWEGYGSDE